MIGVCPHCDFIFCTTYVIKDKCPKCGMDVSELDFIYMPNIMDAYELAKMKVENKKRREEFDEDDSF